MQSIQDRRLSAEGTNKTICLRFRLPASSCVSHFASLHGMISYDGTTNMNFQPLIRLKHEFL